MRKIYSFILLGLVVAILPSQSALAASKNILLKVAFTSQAPLGEWQDERQQDGCEEAAALMAIAWVKAASLPRPAVRASVKAESLPTKKEWRNRIVALSDFEQKKYGEYRDLSLNDIRDWIFKDYFSYAGVEAKKIKSAADIIKELEKGNLVLAPMNGRALKNPYFTAPGPERHMILIKGYDYDRQQFITNDPGTRRGEGYRYRAQTLFKAIRPYKTGNKLAFGKLIPEILVVSP